MAHARPAPSPSSSPSLLLFRSAHPSSPALCRLPPPGGNRPRRGGAASQVLSQLAREDRDRYFAEPLPIEWTLAMQYHSVVKEPMDFATMRGKVHDGEYGTDPRVAVPAFRADFELTVNNAMAFHRPNERCHIMAKRIQRFGLRTIRITFPWTEGLDEVGKAGKKAAAEKKAAESQAAAAGTSAATDAPEPLLESAWDYGAAVVWEPASAGPTAPDLCFVCGGAPHYGGGGGAVEAELLSCIHCAESFHVFCTPQPTATLTEETRLNWTCQRCRTQPMVPKLGGGAEPDAGASASAPSVDIRCLRCDKRRGNMDGFGGYATWVCTDCRCCESCGTLTGKTWSTDGIWCGLCAAAGLEGRYCAVCSKVYANDADEAQTMVACDRCGLWVHKECDGISQIEYQNYCDGAPGFERYECPDCRRDSRHHAPTVMRKIERLIYRIQTKRLAFSNSPPVAADEIGVRHHKLRYNSMLRWCSERAQAGAPWAQKWAPKADPRLLTLAAGNGGAEGGTEDGSDVGAGGGAVPKPTASHPPWARSAWAVTPHPLRIALLARCRWIWECRPRQHRKPRLPPCRQWVVVWERTAHRKPLMLSHLLPVHCPLPPQQVPPRTNWPMAPQIACRETPQTRPREAPQMVPRMAPWTASQMTLQRAHWMAPRTRSWTTPRVRTACPRPTLQRHRRRWRHFNRQPTVAWTLMQTPRRSVPRCRIGSCPRRSPHPRSRLRMAITSDRDLGPLVMRRRRRYPSRPSQSHRQGVAVACQLRLRACRRSPPPPPLPPHRSQ